MSLHADYSLQRFLAALHPALVPFSGVAFYHLPEALTSISPVGLGLWHTVKIT